MSKKLVPAGRLCFRHEGEMWNAYFADKHTMDGSFLLGSIAIRAVSESLELKEQFQELMKSVLDLAIKEVAGVDPIWREPEPAPEHERAGHS